MDADVERAQVFERTVNTSPGLELAKIAARSKEGAWRMSPEQLAELMIEFEQQSIDEYASLDREMQYRETVALEVWRFPE